MTKEDGSPPDRSPLGKVPWNLSLHPVEQVPASRFENLISIIDAALEVVESPTVQDFAQNNERKDGGKNRHQGPGKDSKKQ